MIRGDTRHVRNGRGWVGVTEPRHVPVLLDRVLALLAPALADPAAVLVDATLGLGGHADALLSAHPGLTLVGLDRDTSALARSAPDGQTCARVCPHGTRTVSTSQV